VKAVIVDLVDGQAAALCDDGRVVKLSDAGYTLGQIVQVHEKKRRARWLRLISSVAAAAVLVMAIGGGAAYATPYGVVSLDVNPALEYTINRFDYVLKVEGVNEDGEALLAGMDRRALLHRPVGEAIEASFRQMEAGNYLTGESEDILLAAGAKDEAHAERLVQTLEADLSQGRENLEVHGVTLSPAELAGTREPGMSAGRQHLLQNLPADAGTAPSAADWASRPVRELFRDTGSGQNPPAEARQDSGAQAQPAEARQEAQRDDKGQTAIPAQAARPAQPGGGSASQPQPERPAQEDRQDAAPQGEMHDAAPQGEMHEAPSQGETHEAAPQGDIQESAPVPGDPGMEAPSAMDHGPAGGGPGGRR